ncbi:porphobilinogen synthase [Aquirufa aurantiipilula]|uniref:Delta-aminolevulinic acid dehydratase n=1 Tax=Aquirufa aurantiipilula TaxID=2696561 RepID=A0ABT6BIG8_9BACT|nr:porphobilinogen synthase [Aquirufa aurantiipilula]MBZ1326818.1 porphobilinogen synthase [Aquirufa aurantiipilula]MDF5690249.1 porphobilinogen synthase [Aquirufa aurantiipilula]
MLQRPRRNRQSAVIRSMVEENRLSVKDMMFPLFVMEGQNTQTEISSMPGIYRFTLDLLLAEIESCVKLGIQSFALFPQIPESKKDSMATESYRKGNIYTESIYEISKRFPEISLLTDVAMDPYSSDGHDGIVKDGQILNDETLPVLAKMAIAQAQAGSKLIGPSDMMDGRVGYLRQALDEAGFSQVGIMAYTAKYASAFYGPFRDALESAPKFGDKKTYQMNPANRREALIEAELDEMEGADFLMVKPALAYLDIISLLKENSHLPIAAYNVSGEYAMVKAAAQNGWIDGEKAMLESLLSIKRAGAQVILTYFAKEFAQLKLA